VSYRCRGRAFECPKNSRTPRLAFAAALLCAIGQFAQASTWTVNRTSDGSVGIASNCTSTPQTNFCRLRDAFAASANGDTIVFNVGTNSVITLSNGPLTLASNLTVDASGSPGLENRGQSTLFSVGDRCFNKSDRFTYTRLNERMNDTPRQSSSRFSPTS
jgi:hypothetical protein